MSSDSDYYLWLKPAAPELVRLRELIYKLSKNYATPVFEPHVTLLGRLKGTEDKLTEHISMLAENFQPISFDGLIPDFKDEFYRCLFLAASPPVALMALHQEAVSKLRNSDTRVFEPHVSLIYGDLTVVQKQEIIAKLQNNYPRSISIDRLALYSAEGAPESWQSVQEFTLGR